jgi:hypothetical protein
MLFSFLLKKSRFRKTTVSGFESAVHGLCEVDAFVIFVCSEGLASSE